MPIKRPELALLALVLGLAPGAAEAEPRPTARLAYSAPRDANCPGSPELRQQIATRLGYDPFSSDSSRAISAVIEREGDRLTGRVELRDATGALTGSRVLASTSDCTELAAAMELAIAIAIDPLLMTAPAPSPPPPAPPSPPAPAVSPPPPPPPTVAPAPQLRQRLVVRGSVGGVAALGAAPTISGGLTAQLGLGWKIASFNLEGRFDLPASAITTGALGVETSLYLASFVPCVHYRFLFGCGLASLGALRGRGVGVDLPRTDTTVYAGLGARIGVEARIVRWFALRGHLDVLGNLTRTTFEVDGTEVWTTPRVSGCLGVAAVGLF